MKASPFKCFVDGCIKTSVSQNGLLWHQRDCHPSPAKEMLTGGLNSVSDSPQSQQVQGKAVVPQLHTIPLVQPLMAFKRPPLNAEVV